MTWTRLLAPVGGRRYLDASLGGLFAWSAAHGLCFCDGTLWRIDRAGGRCARVDRPMRDVVYAIAVSAAGRYAFSVEEAVVLEGLGPVAVAGASKLAFGSGGDVWAAAGRQLLRIDGRTGAIVWAVDAWGSSLVVDGDTAALVSDASMVVVTGDGRPQTHEPSLAGAVCAVKARDGRVYVVAGDGAARGLAVWDLASGVETVHEIPSGTAPNEIAVTADGAVAWRSAPRAVTEFDTRSGATRELAFAPGPTVGFDAIDDDRTYVGVLEWESALVRIDRATGRELDRDEPVPAALWGLSVAPDGRVASAHDGEWRVTAPDGALLHREALDGQACDVSFSVDGHTLAVMRPCAEGCRLDLVTCDGYRVTSTRVVRAGGARFLPDGARIALIDQGWVSLCDAETLAVQCVLTHTDKSASIMGLVAADGRLAAYDSEGRVLCFDDPGVTAPAKKPPRHKPALMIPAARVRASTHRVSSAHVGAVFPVGGRLAVFDAKVDGISFVDPATRKPDGRVSDTRGYFMLDAPLYLRAEADGCTVWRLGETSPRASFAAMPTEAACSRDGRFVAVSLHGGIHLARL